DRDVLVRCGGQSERRPNPVRQARGYKFRILNACRADPHCRTLVVHQHGRYQGDLIFPVGCLVVMPNFTSSECSGALAAVFPPEEVVTGDVLSAWESLSGRRLCRELEPFFRPFRLEGRLSAEQLAAVRWVIHPEVGAAAPAPAPAFPTPVTPPPGGTP